MKTVLGALALVVAISGCSSPVEPTPKSLEVTSSLVSGKSNEHFEPLVGSTFQFTAWARLSDGTRRDVTNASTWQTLNANVATVSATGLVQLTGRGTTSIIGTYQGLTHTTPVVAVDQ